MKIRIFILVLLFSLTIEAKEDFVIPESLIQQVEDGNADIAYFIANKLIEGSEKFKADYDKGIEWLEKAATMGHAHAMKELADELDVKEKYSDALNWYQKAADKGMTEVLDSIANYHYHGKAGLEANCKTAYEWYKKAELAEVEEAFNNHAWNLATAKDKNCRNPERALRIISQLWGIYAENDVIPWYIWDTKAAVLASIADFGAAIKLQTWIIEERQKDELNVESYQQRLDLYVLRKPWIEN